MKFNILLLFLFTTFFFANAQENRDPNAHLKIDPETIQTICHSAIKPGIKFLFDKIPDITAFEEDILIAEGYFDEEEIIKIMQINPMKPYEIIRDAWDRKWSKCWCKPDSYGGMGYVDIELLKSEQFQVLSNIYNPRGKIRADINRIVSEHPYTDKEQMTLLDLIEILSENWGDKGGALESGAKSIQRFSRTLRNYGAKKFLELNPIVQKKQIHVKIGFNVFSTVRDIKFRMVFFFHVSTSKSHNLG